MESKRYQRTFEAIGYIETSFPEKFGIPRQSSITESLKGIIHFYPEYHEKNGFKGIEEFEYLWILWAFSEHDEAGWKPTVKPPRLGGNERRGVFATRSPFRPNNIGLSCVKLEEVIETKEEGVLLKVSGVDMLNETPILDIKPYIPYCDAHPEAKGGFAMEKKDEKLEVVFPKELLNLYKKEEQEAILSILEQDPRPAYQDDPTRPYGVAFGDYDVHFVVENRVLTVFEVTKYGEGKVRSC